MAHVPSPRETPTPRDEPAPRGDLPEPANPGDPTQTPVLGGSRAPATEKVDRRPRPALWWGVIAVLVLLLVLWLLAY